MMRMCTNIEESSVVLDKTLAIKIVTVKSVEYEVLSKLLNRPRANLPHVHAIYGTGKGAIVIMDRLRRLSARDAHCLYRMNRVHLKGRLKRDLDSAESSLSSMGYRHQDIHGGNIMRNRAGDYILIDFDVVRRLPTKKRKKQ
jgi:predicted unusual protein kinase regulating ubiquinone biosynthesis (AarF/ABC1/UbiB family)